MAFEEESKVPKAADAKRNRLPQVIFEVFIVLRFGARSYPHQLPVERRKR